MPKQSFFLKKKFCHFYIWFNYISFNKYTIKSKYPIYWLEKTIDVVIILGFKVFFSNNTVNSYWKILMKEFNYNKTGFFIFNKL